MLTSVRSRGESTGSAQPSGPQKDSPSWAASAAGSSSYYTVVVIHLWSLLSERPVRPTASVLVPLRCPVSTHPTQHATRPHVSTGLIPHSRLQHPQPPGHATHIPPGTDRTGMDPQCCLLFCCMVIISFIASIQISVFDK